MPAGTPVEQTAAVLRELGAYLATVPEVTDYQAYAGTAAPINFNGLVRQYYLRAGGEVGDLQVNLVDKHHAQRAEPCDRDARAAGAAEDRPPLRRERQGRRSAARPAGAVADRRRDLRTRGARAVARSRRRCARCSRRPRAWSTSTTAASRRRRRRCCWSTGARPRCWACRSRRSSARCAPAWPARPRATCTTRASTRRPRRCRLPAERQGDLDALLQLGVRGARASWCRSANWSR